MAGKWTVKPASRKAEKEWRAAEAVEPDLMGAERERLEEKPTDRGNPRRTGPLKGKYAERSVAGRKLPQWQHEITAAGRIWYCLDRERRTIWVTKVSLSHPKETD